MVVERSRFLELTVLLATGCGAARSGEQTVPDLVRENASANAAVAALARDHEAGAKAPTEAASSKAPPVAPPNAQSSCNDHGDPRPACLRVSSACEGLREECMDLGAELRPNIAEAWAECMAKARPRTCRSHALGACMRAAIEASCIDAEAEKTCEALMAECRTNGRNPKYTLEQCAKVLSATAPGAEGDWRKVDEERLGHGPSAESCSLTFVLPYQPWGSSWR